MSVQDFPSQPTVIDLMPGPGEWTEAAYYFVSERGQLVELSDGNLEILPMPTDYHQLISGRLFTALFEFVTQRKLGQVRYAPLPVRLWEGKIREPDLMFMSAEHANRIQKYWGVPDLVVEIISDDDPKRDRVTKMKEYARAGISEYWLIDPQAKTIDLMRRKDAEYELLVRFAGNEALTSPTFPDFQYSLADLFAEA